MAGTQRHAGAALNDTDLHETIRSLYEGIFDPLAWQKSLRALRDTVRGVQASLVIRDTVQDRFVVSELVEPAPGLRERYRQDFEPLAPARPFIPRMNVGSWYIDARDLGEAAMRRLPVYGEFLREFGLGSVMACMVDREPSREIYLALLRPAGAEPFTSADAARIDWVIPHIRQALSMRDRALALTAATAVSTQLLDQLGFGVIVLDAHRKVLLNNRDAEPWLRRLLPGDNLKNADWTLSRPFHDMLAAACSPSHDNPAQAAIATSRTGQEARVVVLPLPAGHALSAPGNRPCAMVAIDTRGVEAPRALAAVLRDLYGLTPAETRLACALTTGIGLPEACEQLNIRRETGRSQLKTIFTKTGVSTQAQLAHLTTQLGAILGSTSNER